MKKNTGIFDWVGLLQLFLVLASIGATNAAVFPTAASASDNVRLEVTDTTGGLSWNPPAITPAPNALTVMAWVKISIPTGTELTSDMTILGNRKTLDWNQPHAWRFYFNINTGNIEFSARGTSTLTPIKLVERPYLDRWYHLAVVRSNTTYTPYVDGRALTAYSQDIGISSTTDGISIGGFKGGEKFWGEIQEATIIQAVQNATAINTNRLRDIPSAYTGLKGYYKLAYSATPADNTKNFAATPPTGTENAAKVGTGTIDFPETDKQGEQSLFDSQKNNGRDALAPLAGAFSWQRTLLSRPTAGIPFEFRVGYNSGISFNSQALELGNNMFEEDAVLGPGWRHSFQTRLIPGSKFLVGGTGFIGLLLWDGSLETWQKPTGQPYRTVHGEYRGELITDPSDSDYMLWITTDRLIYRFYHPSTTADAFLAGKLAEIRDFNGNRVVLTYEPNAGLLDTVTDTAGTVWQFNYNAGLLKTVTSLGWTTTFNYDAQNKLQDFSHRGPAAYEVAPLLSTTWTFGYTQPGGVNSPYAVNSVTTPIGSADVTVSYDKYGRKTSETDGGNRSTSYQYLAPGPRQITRTDGDGFKWIDTFDRKGHVIAKADPLGNTTRFEYYAVTNGVAENNLVGGTPSSPGALKRQTEPLGWVTTFDTYDDRANLLQKTDALGYAWKWSFAKSSDPAGANGKLTDGNAIPVTSLLNRPLTDTRPRTAGETADWQNRYTYDAHGNLLQHADDLGTLATYTYDTRGLAKTAKDGNYSLSNPSISSTEYDLVTGYRISSTDPYLKTTTYQTTELGWVKSATNSIGETSTSEFDINGRVIRSTNAAGHTVSNVIDAIGRQRFVTDAKVQTSESQYDNSNLRTWTKDRAGQIATVQFNNRSLPYRANSPNVPISQPTGAPVQQSLTTLRSYDNAGRPLRETDPAGDYIEHTYDANGNETITRDKLGRLYRKQYDALNRMAVEVDPLGNTRSTTFDEAGRVLTITNPNGSITRHEYDGRGRLKKWTDPEGNVWIYTYDGVGNITDIQDALSPPGHYLMTYDLRNARLTEENQDHLHWTYTYDDLSRLKSQAEPTGITRTLNYDPAGRLFFVQFSTGRMNVLSYDNNGSVTVAIRIDAGTQLSTFTTFDYDSLDRPISSTDIFGKKVEYGYDALSRVTSLTYPGGKILSQEFDILSRLVRQTTPANWGSHTLTYSWDKEGRLLGQTYPNGMIRSASYDDSGRQTALSYIDSKGTAETADDAIQIALSYGYDHNGNQTSAKEKGLAAYTPPVAHDETSAYTAAGRVQTRTDAADLTGAKNWTYEFKNADNTPSFNLSKAINPVVGNLALTYDEDSRTTQLVVTPPTGSSSTISNRYDATGRRISRTLTTPTSAASETRYVLNLIGGMERILADTNASGTISSYYIYGPDLAVKIDATDPTQITCFHSDASGNIVRTTDKTRAAVSQYAYSDYGRSFATTAPGNTDINPYRFVGSQGVMEEPILPGLYFMRARYYLADAGVFLSVDPVKNIEAGWKPETYNYASGNPVKFTDPEGEMDQETV
ncbi:MAG: RHS repeat-associated core domain-containing protein, partial [Luteolibacter sp.]